MRHELILGKLRSQQSLVNPRKIGKSARQRVSILIDGSAVIPQILRTTDATSRFVSQAPISTKLSVGAGFAGDDDATFLPPAPLSSDQETDRVGVREQRTPRPVPSE